jgi:DNA-binding MarR family transcriptional regulator
MPNIDTLETARQIVGIIPLVMRIVGAEIRRNPQLQDASQIGLMRMLKHGGACTMTDLADRWTVSLPTMSRSVRRLEERDWVKLSRSAHDRRQVLIELTPIGQAVLDETYSLTARRVEELVIALSPDDLVRLNQGLAVLRAMFEVAVQSETEGKQLTP